MTRWPISYRPSSPAPSSSIVPTGSWPSTRPERTGYSPRMMWMSVPQIVVVVILMTASPGPECGRGTSSRDTRSLPAKTMAFMVVKDFSPSEEAQLTPVGGERSAIPALSGDEHAAQAATEIRRAAGKPPPAAAPDMARSGSALALFLEGDVHRDAVLHAGGDDAELLEQCLAPIDRGVRAG